MTNICFIDTETTGLDPERHEIWEVAVIVRAVDLDKVGHGVAPVSTDTEYVWHLPVDLSRADPEALRIGRFHDRNVQFLEPMMQYVKRVGGPSDGDDGDGYMHVVTWVRELVELTRGAVLVANNPSFDVPRLERLVRQGGQCPMWTYHPVDIKALAAGAIAGLSIHESDRNADVDLAVATPPWSTAELARAVGVDPDQFDLHTALGDARLARAIYDQVLGS